MYWANFYYCKPKVVIQSQVTTRPSRPAAVIQGHTCPIIVQPLYALSGSHIRCSDATTPLALVPNPVFMVDQQLSSAHTLVHHHIVTPDDGLRNRSSGTHVSAGFATSRD